MRHITHYLSRQLGARNSELLRRARSNTFTKMGSNGPLWTNNRATNGGRRRGSSRFSNQCHHILKKKERGHWENGPKMDIPSQEHLPTKSKDNMSWQANKFLKAHLCNKNKKAKKETHLLINKQQNNEKRGVKKKGAKKIPSPS